MDLKVHPGQNGASQVPGCICLPLFPQTKVLGCRSHGHFRDNTFLHILLEQSCQPAPIHRVQGRPSHRLPARPCLPLPHLLAYSTDALLGPAQCRLKPILCFPTDGRLTADCRQDFQVSVRLVGVEEWRVVCTGVGHGSCPHTLSMVGRKVGGHTPHIIPWQ